MASPQRVPHATIDTCQRLYRECGALGRRALHARARDIPGIAELSWPTIARVLPPQSHERDTIYWNPPSLRAPRWPSPHQGAGIAHIIEHIQRVTSRDKRRNLIVIVVSRCYAVMLCEEWEWLLSSHRSLWGEISGTHIYIISALMHYFIGWWNIAALDAAVSPLYTCSRCGLQLNIVPIRHSIIVFFNAW